MNAPQICAGKLPPETEIPWTLRISICAFGKPTQTAVARFGV